MVGIRAQGPEDKAAGSAAVRALPAERGFTLIELLVTISVMAILLAIGVPYFGNATLGSKLSSYANNLVAGAYIARSEAIKRNAPVTLCASSNGTSCTGAWEQGWIVLLADGATVVQRQQALTTGLKVTETLSGATSLVFQPSGVGLTTTAGVPTNASLTVCRATPMGSMERVVSISTTGRASVAKTATGVCS
jgi:type IV fimbrial biogenesis protein FimT